GRLRPVLGLIHVVDLANLSAGGGDQHHPVPGLVRLLHDAAGHDRLVVGMRVDQEKRAHSSSNSLARSPVPGGPMMRSAASSTSGGAPATATARPAHASIGLSLRPSPTATVSAWDTPSRPARNWSAVPLSASGTVISR